MGAHTVLGLGLDYRRGPDWTLCWVDIPYWLLILVFGSLLLLVWRKTGQRKQGQGFPVELAAKKETA